MHAISSNDEPTGERIGYCCTSEAGLAADIRSTGIAGECSYCSKTTITVTIEALADRIEIAFSDHYRRTFDQPDSLQERLMADRESRYSWTREGDPVIEAIQDAAGIDDVPAEDVLKILQDRHSDFDSDAMQDESEFDGESHYKKRHPDDRAWHEEWDRFEHSLKTEARFFSRVAVEQLAEVFGDIDKLGTRDGRQLVIDAGPGAPLDHLHRARVFYADKELEKALRQPDLRLGPPPNTPHAGRMNAQGISVFYGATSQIVAITEVRPPVGSKVAVATFTISRTLRLLDLTALADVHVVSSIFDPSLKRRLERAGFLRTLCNRMTRAVMPDDKATQYLPTQAVADFLATMNEPLLDGIIFPSTQAKAGSNVVLIRHAARVEPIAVEAIRRSRSAWVLVQRKVGNCLLSRRDVVVRPAVRAGCR